MPASRQECILCNRYFAPSTWVDLTQCAGLETKNPFPALCSLYHLGIFTLKTAMAYPISSIHPLISPDLKTPKKVHASVTTNIGLTSRLVTHRLWPCLRGIHLGMFATAASSRRRFTRNRGAALYCAAHNHGNCATAHAGHEETVGSRGDNMYVLPSTAACQCTTRPVLTFPSAPEHSQHGRNWCVFSIEALIFAFVLRSFMVKVIIKAPRRFRHMVSVHTHRISNSGYQVM